jgi:hypothetical protein
MKQEEQDGFEKREEAALIGYWKDPRWVQVGKLRKEKKHIEANSLVFQIRSDWGVD